MSTPGEISLYFHVPFCLKKCPYCHFYSVYPKDDLIKLLTQCFLKEIDKVQGKIVSIYFGGGTPSLLGNNIKAVLDKIRQKHDLKNVEITLETNPEDVSLEKIKNFKQAGVNRISLGVQSFNDFELEVLKRSHSAQKSISSIENIYEAGIENISIDLMYDLPLQSLQSFDNSLKIALQMPISHLSLYNLTFEEKTPFFKEQKELKKKVPDEATSVSLLEKACEYFSKNGFKRYEISAFAKNGKVSNHNIGYWIGRPFLGFGPSAFSYFEKKRYKNISNVQKYIELVQKDLSSVDFSEMLPYPENLKELLAINLRMLDGIDIFDFQKKEGLLPQETLEDLEKMTRLGFLEKEINTFKLSKKGLMFYDTVAIDLI